MGIEAKKTASASGEILPAEKLTEVTATPTEDQQRIESDTGPKTFLDEKQLLARLPISRRTAFTWIKDGKIPCVKICRRKLFHWPSVEAALLRLQRGAE